MSFNQPLLPYVFRQYADDENILAIFKATQNYIQSQYDQISSLNIPVWTSPNVTGGFLDWVAKNLYAIQRPSLASGELTTTGGVFNTNVFNSEAFNAVTQFGQQTVYVVNDDYFKRILTWNLYRGDGAYQNTRWLKRRIERFLLGANGAYDAFASNPYPNCTGVRVSYPGANVVNIQIPVGEASTILASSYNGGYLNFPADKKANFTIQG